MTLFFSILQLHENLLMLNWCRSVSSLVLVHHWIHVPNVLHNLNRSPRSAPYLGLRSAIVDFHQLVYVVRIRRIFFCFLFFVFVSNCFFFSFFFISVFFWMGWGGKGKDRTIECDYIDNSRPTPFFFFLIFL